MKSMLVIGLGRFGRYLAKKLNELGNEVMVVDKCEERVNAIASHVTAAQIGDCQDREVLKALGVDNFDICFVCISDDFQSSLEVTSMLKELGAQYVVSKAEREKQTKFLQIIGADSVVHTEKDMAQRIALKYSADSAFDYIELAPEYAIFEIKTPISWVGKEVSNVDVRMKYKINIIGIKQDKDVTPLVSSDHVFQQDEHLYIAGSKKDVMRLMDAKKGI